MGFATKLRRAALLTCVITASVLMTGCISVKQYVDPTLPKVAYTDLKPVETKQTVQLFLEFQTNGATNASVTDKVRPMVLATMKKSELFADVVVAPASSERKLFITINNLADTKDAAAKGFGTGLTLGLAGSMVTDNFVMNATYVAPGQPEVKHTYRHAIHSTIGNADGPAGLTPVPKGQAAPIMLDGLMLNLLRDMSAAGELK